jgi:phage-related protein (TIGR01555 family)
MFERLRAAWRAFWKSTTAVPVAEPERPARRISNAAMWEAERHGAPTIAPDMVFRRAEPMPGIVPAGMAMDYSPTSLDQVAAYAATSLYSEGLGFLGYAYLAELSQRAEYRNVNSIWAEYCTKKWIKLTGDDERIKLIQQRLEDLKVRDLFNYAITQEGFFGRIHLFMDFDDYDKPAELLSKLLIDKAKIGKERPLKRLNVVEPLWSYPGPYNAQNPLAPDFYNPATWYVSGRTVHASRMLTLVSNPVPNMLKPAYAFGGVSRAQQCKAYVDNWLRSRQSSSDLLHAFSVMVLKTDMEGVLGGGGTDVVNDFFSRVDLFNKTRDNRGTFVIDKNAEDFANVAAPITGVAELVAQSLEQISAISGIPISILLGQTPNGLNASSDGEIRIFYDRILSFLDTNVRPLLQTLLDVVQLSLFDEIDQEIGFEFEALWEMADKDLADIRKSDAEADATYINAGVVDADEVRERLRNDETSLYHGVDLSGSAPEPEEPDDLDLKNGAGGFLQEA